MEEEEGLELGTLKNLAEEEKGEENEAGRRVRRYDED